MSKIEKRLGEIVARIIETRRAEPRISPSWVATEAMHELDPTKAVELRDPDIWAGCHLALRQLARGQLADRFDPDKPEGDELPLFKELQWRYPMAHTTAKEEPRYVLRDLMDGADVEWNIRRLEAEGKAKLDHADALRAWHAARRVSA